MPAAKASNGKRVNKMDAMRQTIKALGKDAGAKDIQGHLKKIGVDMSIDMVYTYKANVAKELGSGLKGKRRRKMGRPAGIKVTGAISIADIEAVNAIVKKLGAEKVQKLASVLG